MIAELVIADQEAREPDAAAWARIWGDEHLCAMRHDRIDRLSSARA